MNADYIVELAKTFEARYGVKFEGMSAGPVTDMRERLLQFKTNIDVAMSVLDKNGLGDWLADRLVEIGDRVVDKVPLRDRRHARSVPRRPAEGREPARPSRRSSPSRTPCRARARRVKVALFRKPGEAAGARRAISEIIKWLNYVTDNRVLTVAADLSESVNLEHGSIWGHYDPETNPLGTRLKAAIQEAGNVSTAIGLVSQNASVDPDKFAGVWAFSGTYGAFTPLMYLPARVWSQQNQDSKFRTGVLHILAAHSGPETAADARTHFGIFSPQVWKLFPRGQIINLSFWDYNDVAPGYFAAAEIAAREKKVGIITIEVARPDLPVADRSTFADTDVRAAAKGLYVIRDFAPGPRHGYVVCQGAFATFNTVKVLPKLAQAGVNVKVIAAVSEELFDRQPEAYRRSVLPAGREAGHDVHHGRHATRLAAAQRRRAGRRLLADGRLGQPVADGRPRGRRHRRSAPRSGFGVRGRQAFRRRAAREVEAAARRARIAGVKRLTFEIRRDTGWHLRTRPSKTVATSVSNRSKYVSSTARRSPGSGRSRSATRRTP